MYISTITISFRPLQNNVGEFLVEKDSKKYLLCIEPALSKKNKMRMYFS